jgi:hypothetical protein
MTSIERNTKKIVQGKLDALYATQQKLNNNSKGSYGQYGMEVEDPTNMTPWFPSAANGQAALQLIANRNTPSYYGGWMPDVNVSANRTYKNSQGNPFQLPDITVTGQRNNTPFSQQNRLKFPVSTPGNEQWFNAPKSNLTKDPVNIAAANSDAVKEGGIAAPFMQKPTVSDNTIDYTFAKYTPPDVVDNVNTDLAYGTNEARRNAPGPTFSNPLDDPNSASFDPAKSKANTLAEAGVGPGFDWGKAGNFAMQAAPAIYNMIKGLQKPQKVKANYNPYEGSARRLMANRRFDINPLLQDNRTNQAIMNRNIKSAANSRGELMSNLTAAQNSRSSADARAWSQKNNVDNQYLAEQAQMDYGLGRERAQMDWMTQDANARNLAATNQFLGQGLQDISNMSQTRELMDNQRNMDSQRNLIFRDMYKNMLPFMSGINDLTKAV